MIQIRSLGTTASAQTFAMAVVVALLMALTAIGGYEIGLSRAQSHYLVVPRSAGQTVVDATPAPPIDGLQP